MQKKPPMIDDVLTIYINDNRSDERVWMSKTIIPCVKCLKKMKYPFIMPFVDELVTFGFKNKEIAKLILDFLKELENDHEPVGSIKKRVIGRGNNFDRNNILNRLIFQYKDKFLRFIENSVELKESKMLILASIKNLIEQGNAYKTEQEKANKTSITQVNDLSEDDTDAEKCSTIKNVEYFSIENEENSLSENYDYFSTENEENPLYENETIYYNDQF